MKKYLLALIGLVTVVSARAQLALEDFNMGVLPSGWVLIGDGHKVVTGFSLDTPLTKSAWIPYNMYANGDFSMLTTSLSSPPAKADRWLITPAFKVTNVSTFLKWDDWNFSSGERLQILVSPTAGTTASSFTKIIYDDTSKGFLETHIASLGAYNGQTIRVAFRDTMTNINYLMVDNVQTAIMPPYELELTNINPGAGSLLSYGLAGDTRVISGKVTNKGLNTVNAYTTKYQFGSGPIQSEAHVAYIPPFYNSSFTFAVPISITASPSDLKVWIEMAGDTVFRNDTLYTRFTTYTTKPNKIPLIEEATGTWCASCVRGIVYMDSINKAYHNKVSLAAIHTRDPMLPIKYGVYINSVIPSYPSIVVDRANNFDPDKIFTAYTNEINNFGVADIALSYNWLGNKLSVSAEVTPTVATKADYRLALVLTENRVSKNEIYWEQHNIYSGGGLGPMQNMEYDFVALPDPVPADSMRYDFVARAIYPDVGGAAGSLPLAMLAGTSYNYTFPSITVDTSAWKPSQMSAVVLLIANSDGTVLNSQNIKCTMNKLALAPQPSGILALGLYPNPAKELINVQFELKKEHQATIDLLDMLGNRVKTIYLHDLPIGLSKVPISLSNLAPGTYILKVTTDNGSESKSFSVLK